MNEHEEDIRLARLLQDHSYRPSENRWFTHRLLNRLPARRRHGRLLALVYALAAVMCVFSWRDMLGSLNGVFTVRDLLHAAVMAAVTLYAVASALVTALRGE